jgi:beta-glucosidase
MVVSDYTAIDQIPNIETSVEKAAAAINAGNDVDFPHGADYKNLQEAIDKGLVKPEVLERAVKDVLRTKFRLGLFDKDAYLYSKEDIKLDTPEERQTAYDIAAQSVVLLENNGILPLNTSNSSKNILLTGPNANSIWAMCGDYTYPAMSYFWKRVEDVADRDNPHIVKLLEGMQNRKPEGVNVMYSRGCDWTEDIETKYGETGDARAWEYYLLHRKVDSGEKADKAEALQMAKEADVIIAAVGENVMLCGENRDRQGLRLPGKQEQYVEELINTGKPVVLVVFGGRAQVISGLAEKCAAVIQAWYPGEEGGNAVADILYGKISPSAKLSVSYPNTELYEPLCYNSLSSDTSHSTLLTPHSSNIQWPFGYGLTYAAFDYQNLQVASEAQTTDDTVELTFQVKNTGSMAATEIAQIYLSPKDSTLQIRPIQLQGFARIALEPGQTKTITTRLSLEQFGFYTHNGDRQWNIEPGTYIVKVGASSADIRLQQEVILRGKAFTKHIRDHYFSESIVSQ